ncbi:NF-kappa-B inhibitor-interacting Ras-like protein 1 [Orchesella cincta]|uniref:NF-kappa-B inhibitor-interacting Ras-like protein 1 n=1 Tax=Orchesella cincta TaxID=48709 RepID=A0A1D2MPZ8_ORCCI|nr:NF-kappa-B inhibitor-interacting Ras-like protein 1 [Orchesella cincta]
MGKANKVVVVGMKGVGKTTLLEQLIYGNFENQDIHPTIEDIYAATVDTDRGTKEMIRFYDTEGFALNETSHDVSIPKHYHSLADAFVLVYSVNSRQSFEIIDLLKKDIDKNREKREIASVVVAISGRPDEKRQVDPSFAVSWATREKIRHFEVSILERSSLTSPFTYLASKLNPPPTKTGFAPLNMVTRKAKE